MDVKFLKGLKENLKNVPIVNGQILFTTNSKEIFIDVGTERLEIADTDVLAGNLAALVAFVGTLPEGATADTIVGYINEKFAAATSGATEAVEALAERVTTAEGDIDTLEGKVEALEIDAEKHADKTYVDEELAKKADKTALAETDATLAALKKVVDDFFAEDAAVNDVIDTLKEIATYIANDKEGAADMAARIGALETKVDVDSVTGAIAVETNRATGAEEALGNRIKDLEDNKAGYATTGQVATAKQEAIDAAAADATGKANAAQSAAEAKAAELDTALHTAISAEIDADVKALADGAVKTNADDIAAIKEALTWGTF